MKARHEGRPGRAVPTRAAGLLLVAAAAAAPSSPAVAQTPDQTPHVERAEFSLELRVGLQDRFPGRLPDGEVDAWQAGYLEAGEIVFSRESDGAFETFRVSALQSVQGLRADVAPTHTDGCGNRWNRRWEDPAHVESESRVSLEVVEGGEAGVMLAIWYRPVSFSLMDPGGPQGMGECADGEMTDPPRRRTLTFEGEGLQEAMETEAGPSAMRDDGMLLLGVVAWRDLVSGDEVVRSVDYRYGHVRFRSRLTLTPELVPTLPRSGVAPPVATPSG